MSLSSEEKDLYQVETSPSPLGAMMFGAPAPAPSAAPAAMPFGAVARSSRGRGGRSTGVGAASRWRAQEREKERSAEGPTRDAAMTGLGDVFTFPCSAGVHMLEEECVALVLSCGLALSGQRVRSVAVEKSGTFAAPVSDVSVSTGASKVSSVRRARGSLCEVLAHSQGSEEQVCYVRSLCREGGKQHVAFVLFSALVEEKPHAAAVQIARAIRLRAWRRSKSAQTACAVIQMSARLLLSLRLVRRRKVHKMMAACLEEGSSRAIEVRQIGSVREVEERMTLLSDAADGMALGSLTGVLSTAKEMGMSEHPSVRKAAHLYARAELVRLARYLLIAQLQPTESLLDQLVAPGGKTSKLPPTTGRASMVLPPKAQQAVDAGVSALMEAKWDQAASLLDDARDLVAAASSTSSASSAAQALDVLYALALFSDPEGCDQKEAMELLRMHLRSSPKDGAPCDPLLLLVAARISNGGACMHTPASLDPEAIACLALYAEWTAGAEGRTECLMTQEERAEVESEVKWREDSCCMLDPPCCPSRPRPKPITKEDRWKTMSDQNESPSGALKKLMQLRGLQHVKALALELHTRVQAEKKLPPESRVRTSNNFSLLGNPGTGKTTAARLIGELLVELGVRRTMPIVEKTGEELLRDGSDKFASLLERVKRDNGVLFIDEAYMLEPKGGSEGRAIVSQILAAAENDRDKISFIFAGYKDDIEDKLYGFNVGLKSRFRDVVFDDFTQPEVRRVTQTALMHRQCSQSVSHSLTQSLTHSLIYSAI